MATIITIIIFIGNWRGLANGTWDHVNAALSAVSLFCLITPVKGL